MKHHFFKYAVAIAGMLSVFSCTSSKELEWGPGPVEESERPYKNPVIQASLPDPTVIRAEDGLFYLYATEEGATPNMPIYSSKNLINWDYVGTVFTDQTRPQDYKDHYLWAPEIRRIKGKYVLFYSLGKMGDTWNTLIGYAVSDSPKGPFVKKGTIFTAGQIGVEDSIDPFLYEEDGRYYLLWGSFYGIYCMDLTIDDNLNITYDINTKKQVAAGGYPDSFEGVDIWKKDGYYYLFASTGTCCEKLNSTYQLVVGRSQSLFGPYVNKEGIPMLDKGYTPVIHKSRDFVGPGHNSILFQDDKGDTWTLYHAYKTDMPDRGRQVLLDRIRWGEDGWPFVENGEPSTEAARPVINKK